MDLSKLPKLSDSSQAPQPAAPAPDPAASESRPVDYGGYRPAAPSGIGADIWFISHCRRSSLLLFWAEAFSPGRIAANDLVPTFRTRTFSWTFKDRTPAAKSRYFDPQGFTVFTDAGMLPVRSRGALRRDRRVDRAARTPAKRALVYLAATGAHCRLRWPSTCSASTRKLMSLSPRDIFELMFRMYRSLQFCLADL